MKNLFASNMFYSNSIFTSFPSVACGYSSITLKQHCNWTIAHFLAFYSSFVAT